MTKYHINKHGVPAICKAKLGNCPLGEDTSHFNTQEEAQQHIDKQNEHRYDLIPKLEGVDNNFDTQKDAQNEIQNEQKQYIKDNNLFGLKDMLDEEDWDDTKLVQSEIITNVSNVIQYYWVDKNDYSKNRVLLDYMQGKEASTILSTINNFEKYNVDNYFDSVMLLAEDILLSID